MDDLQSIFPSQLIIVCGMQTNYFNMIKEYMRTNNVYNSATKTNQNSSVIYTTRFIASNSINGLVGNILTFTKNEDLANINIFYQRVSPSGTNYAVSTGFALPHIVFMFKIYGVTKTERIEDLNSSRMFNK